MEAQSSSNPFQVIIRVRYAECDAQSVVFNARYADYADIAATEFIRAVIGSYKSLLDQNLDTQVVSLAINWKSSAKFDDTLRLDVQVSKVGNTSYTLQVDMFEYASSRPIATCNVVYVMVSTDGFHKTPIPESLKQVLLAGAPDKTVNMAGDL